MVPPMTDGRRPAARRGRPVADAFVLPATGRAHRGAAAAVDRTPDRELRRLGG
jgi:hypothetical protein